MQIKILAHQMFPSQKAFFLELRGRGQGPLWVFNDRPHTHMPRSVQTEIGRTTSSVTRALYHATPRKRKDILTHCSTDFLQALNLLKGNILLSPGQYKSLKQRKRIIRLVDDKRTSLKCKRETLVKQSGGFILPQWPCPSWDSFWEDCLTGLDRHIENISTCLKCISSHLISSIA